jgi:hypothetical protein
MGCAQSRIVAHLKRQEARALRKYVRSLKLFGSDSVFHLRQFVTIHNERVIYEYKHLLVQADDARRKGNPVKAEKLKSDAGMIHQQYIQLSTIPTMVPTMPFIGQTTVLPPSYGNENSIQLQTLQTPMSLPVPSPYSSTTYNPSLSSSSSMNYSNQDDNTPPQYQEYHKQPPQPSPIIC